MMAGDSGMGIAAVIFDLDGVLVDSEGVWNAAREEVARQHGGQWPEDAHRILMGMSSTEWSAYMHDELGVKLPPKEISDLVVSRLADLYRRQLPLLPGAREVVTSLASWRPLALASSANRSVIELVLDMAGFRDCFAATVSSEEVPRGKPAPDVYLEAARRLEAPPERCVAVEDSSNGLRSAAAAGMIVVAVPNREFPPSDDALAVADAAVDALTELSPDRLELIARTEGRR
jgi:HAD superfamily hydrolase (TIGR01509 family)